MKLNAAAVEYLQGLIRAGAIERTADWRFSAEDGTALLGADGGDWTAFGRVHLGIDTEASAETKERFGYPAAKIDGGQGVKVYISALDAIRSRAAQQNESDIFEAAGKLLDAAEPDRASANSLAALCFAVENPQADSEWRELIPAANAAGKIEGRDGRWFRTSANIARKVAAAFSLPIPVDINHAQEIRSRAGATSPAQGWIEALEERAGALWGRINWNQAGLAVIKDRLYRFLSAAFTIDEKTHTIRELVSVALVNQPNFPLALNHSSYDPEQEEPAVDKAIREALGLDAEADAAAAVTAINSMKSARGTPSLDKFVPRADYDAALNRASAAEHTLAERDEAQLKDEIETAINAALEAGKITPATADYHRAQCAFEGGLERFTAFVKAAPELAGASGLEGKRPDEGSALNAEDKRVAAIFGNSPDDIQKYGQEAA